MVTGLIWQSDGYISLLPALVKIAGTIPNLRTDRYLPEFLYCLPDTTTEEHINTESRTVIRYLL
jgi:hypothetical protein